MAKSSLPRIDGTEVVRELRPVEPVAAKLVNPPACEGYIPRNVDVRMSRAQARILRDKLRELQDSGAKTADGKPVNNRAQAVRWVIENLVTS